MWVVLACLVMSRASDAVARLGVLTRPSRESLCYAFAWWFEAVGCGSVFVFPVVFTVFIMLLSSIITITIDIIIIVIMTVVYEFNNIIN